MSRNLLKGYIFVIASAVIFGCNALMVNYIYDQGINAISLVFLRNLLSIPVLGAVALRRNRTLRIPRKSVLSVAFIGIMGCCLTPILLFSSYRYIASGTATVFHFIYPAVVVLGEILVFRHRPQLGSLISVLVCAVGIALFFDPNVPLNWTGSILALTSGVTYAVYILQLSNFRYPKVAGFLLSFYVSVISSCIMFAVCTLTGTLTLPVSVTGWIYCFLFSLVINVGAVVLFQQGTFLVGGERASILSTLEPITSVVVGVLVFQEIIGLRTVAGAVLVLLASVLITVTNKNKSE